VPATGSPAPGSPAPRQSALRTAFAGLIGNVLEWFDFAVFGYFSGAIGKQFFPANDPAVEQLSAFAVFAVGFFARPAGGIVLGMIGDRIGRRALLTLSIAMMGGATLAIGLLPTYDQIGVAAPLLLVLMRIVQGFSLGGEFTGSMVYTTELAPPLLRGLVSSSTAAGTTIGFILGSGTSLLVRNALGGEADVWGWRLPFLGSVLLVLAGWLLRRGIHESAQGQKAAQKRAPILESLLADLRPIVQTFGIVAMTNAAYYVVFTFAVEQRKAMEQRAGLHGEAASAFQLVNTLTLFAVLFAKVFGGWMSDRVGRRRLMMGLTVAMMASIYYAVPIMLSGNPTEFMLGQLLMAVPIGMALGLQGAMVVEIFPLRTRVTSMSFAYSITLALAGGVAPFVASWLMATYGDPHYVSYYVMLYGVAGLALMWPMKETNARSLDE
jgi:MHS family proline/betaine transporter-like MFS transporter